MLINDYLTIAGIAYRRKLEVDSTIQANPGAFPSGPDDTQWTGELSICEAIIANVRALLSVQLLQLEFTSEGRARAVTPDALKGGDYDQGAHDEPFK
ncbi:hypothetical protein [Bradyrhizobium sp. ERR14]|uniref:hypothetical protein n=1 Tax=Bradyrhizobium sp. ERR14 TaxID=2663837 RepID=UPI0016108AFD|nr:hypothetical protein [Bradyrhizobium sp. ERR14]MBB4395090.1 hypothetical protein [Bradyrhizobium sp. ERR14]